MCVDGVRMQWILRIGRVSMEFELKEDNAENSTKKRSLLSQQLLAAIQEHNTQNYRKTIEQEMKDKIKKEMVFNGTEMATLQMGDVRKTMEQGFFSAVNSKALKEISAEEAQKRFDDAKRELEEKRFAENAARMREHIQMARQNHEIGNQVMAIRAIFGDMPFDEIMVVLQQFIKKYKRNQTKKATTLSVTPAAMQNAISVEDFARVNGRKGKEKQLQNNVKEKFRLGKFQELFQIWAARLQSQEYGVQAKFIAIVQAHYDEYIDDLIAKDVKMSEKDKVLSPDAVRRWLKHIEC